MSQKVIITDHVFAHSHYEEAVAKTMNTSYEKHACTTEEATIKAVQDANVVFVNFAPITENVLSVMAKNSVIIRYGIGYDNVDIQSAKKYGISVCNVPDYGVDEVADHTMSMMLTMLRKINIFTSSILSGSWSAIGVGTPIASFSDTKIGLIGFGRIAQEVTKRLTGFDFQIFTYDPFIDKNAPRQLGATYMELEDIMQNCDVLSLHLPLNDKTKNIINRDAMLNMKKGAYIVNCSRGGLIDESALADNLNTNHIAGAALDVFEHEPLEQNSLLRNAKNIILTPHAAFYSQKSLDNLQRLASEEALRALRNEPLRCEIT